MLARHSLPIRGHGQRLQKYRQPTHSYRVWLSSNTDGIIKDRILRSRWTTLQHTPASITIDKIQRRTFTSTTTIQHAPAASEQTASLAGQEPLPFPSELFGRSKDVRSYLRQWSTKNQETSKEGVPSEVHYSHSHLLSLPNSIFAKSDQRSLVEEMNEGDEADDVSMEDDAFAIKALRELYPGDLFFMNTPNIHPQYAVYLGHCGYQAQYLLADGRWFVHNQTQWHGHIIRKFATRHEIETIKPFLPHEPIEASRDASEEEKSPLALATVGDIPLTASSPILTKMKSLAQEVEEYKRQYGQVLANLHENIAHESEFKHLRFEDIVQEYFNVDYKSMAEALKWMVMDNFSDNSTMLPLVSRETYVVSVMPKRISRAVAVTTEWARQYQDAAARASMGKDVSEELQKNPLTSFISKARRLITKSRKIRPLTPSGQLGSTFPAMMPSNAIVRRVATGEAFNASDRAIIEFLWLTYVKGPPASPNTMARHTSIGSLLLRAVGAYPKLPLDGERGRVFLCELGCLDPWNDFNDHSVVLPLATLGLNHDARVAKEKADEALSQLKANWNGIDLPFHDTMPELRKDWGDIEVFTIDKPGTIIVDDGISLELSKEHPDHYWIHLHFGHLSAFLPYDHPFRENFRLMAIGHYNPLGNEAVMPYEVLECFSIAPNKPVITCSTLLARDGSVKKIEMTPGIVRNVIKLYAKDLSDLLEAAPIARHQLRVGRVVTKPKDKLSMEQRQAEDVNKQFRKHESKIRLLQQLLIARWDARFREHSDYIKLPRIPKVKSDVYVDIDEEVDRNHNRIFRSEHCYGDPGIRIEARLLSLDEQFKDQPEKREVVSGSMLLAQESAGLWLRERNVPAIYRTNSARVDFDVEKLNKLHRHEGYLSPTSGESTVPSRHLLLNTAQMSSVTNPLRKYRDLIIHYNIDAYLKAQAKLGEQEEPKVEYPNSLTELTRSIREIDHGKEPSRVAGRTRLHWTSLALSRAFGFGEAQLPAVWDMVVGNPVRIGQHLDPRTQLHGTLLALGVNVKVLKSEKGWENQARFRQYLPVKLVEIGFREEMYCEAVGPPSDSPIVNGGSLQYPELGL